MRTIVTNDLETRIRTTETISLTRNGIKSQVITSMIGENEAAELAGVNVGEDPMLASTDPKTLIRTNGDVIYRENNGLTMIKTSEGYTVYDFPTEFIDSIIKLECDAAMFDEKNIVLNVSLGLYITGFDFEIISSYSENSEMKIYFDSQYLGSMKIYDLVSSKYSNFLESVPEDADEETKSFAEEKTRIYKMINSSDFANSQVKFKIFIINNENVNARGFLTLHAHTYEVDDTGKIITNSITKILTEGGATGE